MTFAIPNVVQRQRAKSYKAVFFYLYTHSDRHALIELDASKIAKVLGFSRQQIYNAVRFLKRVNLLKYKIHRTGRGNHSLIWLNWRKPEQKCKAISKRTESKNHIHERSRRNGNAQWNQKLKAFRELFEHSWLMYSEKSLCVSLIGKFIRNRSDDFARALYTGIRDSIQYIEPPNWVIDIKDLARWWVGFMKLIIKRASKCQE